ncbi:MAG: Probable Co/Zn/Cd efflux system membrane fusion protein [uncultured Chloroflexi bacterium]|uniref:Probable Co/Zn/Cd efflux system membrane fusion protein n=1 Tax=uncultured Chloroflexota bacterium TaxID=166587 RepID=A0A6J4JLL8_9CHLR|nr:MAG: Probable Co/Zn/Cd efflux system membrane fusion protein [uncultured Chloroflexota bacterium]
MFYSVPGVRTGFTMSRMLKRRLLAVAFALATLFGFSGHPFFGRIASAALDVSAAEGQLVELLNADRAAVGLPPLQSDPRLMDVARWRSEDMVARTYFGHDMGGFTIGRLLREHQVLFSLAGENIVSNTFEDMITVGLAQAELMKSSSHRENVLRSDYNLVGVGIALGPNRRTVFTQVFVQSAQATPTVQPAPPATPQGTPGTLGTPALQGAPAAPSAFASATPRTPTPATTVQTAPQATIQPLTATTPTAVAPTGTASPSAVAGTDATASGALLSVAPAAPATPAGADSLLRP